MPLLRSFAGISPRITPRLLSDTAAQRAVNCDLSSGVISPVGLPLLKKTLPGSGQVASIYRFGQDAPTADDYWFTFGVDTDVVRGAIAGDTIERTFWTDGVLPKTTDSTLALVSEPYPTNARTLGVPAPTQAVFATCIPLPDPPASRASEDRVYIYTNVNSWSEESAPSPPTSIEVPIGDTVSLTGFSSIPVGDYNVTHRRIYRLVTGTSSASYLYVDEISINDTTYVDSKLAADLQEPCPSISWDHPEAGLKGLIALPNGMLAAFIGRDWYVSDPWHPFAWPKKYSLTVDYPIVAQGAFGQSVVVLTTGNPYIISGTDPSTMSMQKLEIREACVSKRSVAQTGDGVIYASSTGLVYIGQSGNKVLTEGKFNQSQWALYNPTTIHGYFHDGAYIGFYKDAQNVGRGFMLSGSEFTDLDFYADAGFVDVQRDALFVTVGRNLNLWGAGAPAQITWRSKQFEMPAPTNLATGQVVASNYPVTMNVYADGVLKLTKTVANDQPFRLPAGFRARLWELEVVGTAIIYSAAIVGDTSEIANG